MPKKKVEKPQREVTRRQMSHWQRESRLQRFTLIGGIIVVLAILIVVGTGVYMNKYKPFREVVIKAGDTEYNMDYYINMLAFYGSSNPQYIQYMADFAAQSIEQNQFYVQEAAKQFGVTVSDAEIQQYIKDNKLISDQTRKDAVRAQLLQNKLKDYFDKNPDNGVPQSAEQRAVQAMFLESQSQVDAVKTELKDPTNTKSYSDIAAELSLESKSKANNGDFGWVPQGVLASILGNTSDTVLNDTAFGKDITKDNLPALTQVEDKDQAKNIGYWLLEVTETRTNPTPNATPSPSPNASPVPTPTPNNTQVHLLAMLLGSEEQADQIKAKLAAGGEGNDFATLAKANSQYADAATNGGDLGWKPKGTCRRLWIK